MSKPSFQLPLTVFVVVAGAAALGLWVWAKGGAAAAGQSVGAGVVNGAVGAVTGAAGAANDAAVAGVGAVSQTVGLPTPSETVDDPQVVRWIIDNVGQFEASKWGTAWAYMKALFLPSGSGTAPAPGTPAAVALVVQTTTVEPGRRNIMPLPMYAGQVATGDYFSATLKEIS